MLFYLLACCATIIIVHRNLSASATQRSPTASPLEVRELAAEVEALEIDSSHLDESLVALDLLLTAWDIEVDLTKSVLQKNSHSPLLRPLWENDGESDFYELKVLLDYHTAINHHAVTINSRCDTMRQRLTAMK
ncbi:hypothetical protein PSHT_15125 [Puccinia striiformis]|uniref:Uncharacterized protein n=1 Tax=Puccinia striiformis TaxID=27350 RepID=A0A2S4UGK6_9BASI|nr:hypothetical protein PSHT_15125 [Puccinia striiformis]